MTHNTFYHAKIWRDGKIVAQLKGKYNRKKILDDWLTENWLGPLKYQTVESWQREMVLRVWRYSPMQVIIYARMPAPTRLEKVLNEFRPA